MTSVHIEQSISLVQQMLELLQARQDAQGAFLMALVTVLRDQDASLPTLLKNRLEQAAEIHRSDLPQELQTSRKHFEECIGQYRLALEVLEGSVAAGTSAAQH